MASEKISAMTAAGEVDNGDLIPVVQAGANVKATREQLLTAGSTEDISLVGSPGQNVHLSNDSGSGDYQLDDAGGVIQQADGGYIIIVTPVGASLNLDSTGALQWVSGGAGPIMTLGNSGFTEITMNTASSQIALRCSNGVTISFKDNGAGDWTTAPPVDDLEWKYRVAAAVRGLLGGTIP